MNEINTWPGWECVRLLGEGTFGKVYEIQRRDAFGTVRSALKVITIPNNHLHAPIAMSLDSKREYYKQTVEKIYREITLMDQLKGQSNIVSYMDHSIYTPDDGASWTILIRMSLLTPFSRYFESHEMTIPDVIRLGIDIGRALRLCHSKKIMHRDVKPENIFVNPDTGDFAIGDFGISRTLEKEMESNLTVAGTYNYMAPEVFRKKAYGYSADIYSLAMVLYELLNDGNPPFMGSGSYSEADRQQAMSLRFGGSYIPAPKHGSIQLVSCILKALSYDTNNRFESADAFIKALQACPEYEAKETAPVQEGTVYAETPDFGDAWGNNQQPSGSPVYSRVNNWDRNYSDSVSNNADYSYGHNGNNFQNNNYSSNFANNYSADSYNNDQVSANYSSSYSQSNSSDLSSRKQSDSERKAAEQQLAQRLREKAAQEQAAREKAAREKAAQEKAAREKAAREKAAREKAAREKAAQEKAAREKAAREKAAREKAAQEQAAREKAAREKAAREKVAQEKAAREKAAQEKAAREKAAREKATREKTAQKKAVQNRKDVSTTALVKKGNFFTRHPFITFFLVMYALSLFFIYRENTQKHEDALADMKANSVTDHVIEWNDEALEARIREITKIRIRKIRLSDVWTITELNLNSSSSSYDNHKIKNITALGELVNLEDLSIAFNEINDINALGTLTNLRSLNIQHNKIDDISVFYLLSNLEYLTINSNQISDINPLSGLTQLKGLNISLNEISDISALSNLTQLDRLDISNNEISDISTLSELTQLDRLDISNNEISDISTLSGLTQLDRLDISNNEISDIKALGTLTSLTNLMIYNNPIGDILPLASLIDLEDLYASNCNISNISDLSSLTRLTILYLNNNQISDIQPLTSLTSLNNLSLENNNIADISSLSRLLLLTSLNLSSNQISDLTPLSGLTELEHLYISYNLYTDVSPLRSLQKLKYLSIYGNEISDRAPLNDLPKDCEINE